MEVKGVEKNKLNILNKFFSRNTFRHCYEEGYDIWASDKKIYQL